MKWLLINMGLLLVSEGVGSAGGRTPARSGSDRPQTGIIHHIDLERVCSHEILVNFLPEKEEARQDLRGSDRVGSKFRLISVLRSSRCHFPNLPEHP